MRLAAWASLLGCISCLQADDLTAQTAKAAGAGQASETTAAPQPDPVPSGGAAKAEANERPAKLLFGAAREPAPLAARSIGGYARGCLAGARSLTTDGPSWQAMRLSRNRMWGHPKLIELIETFAEDARLQDGWAGLMVGDISQPRGGPMLTGHNSHQIGLDADIWFTPMPDRRLTPREREELAATSMLAPGSKTEVDPRIWTDKHVRLVRRAASYPDVERVLVHPAIKKALCDGAGALGPDRKWLNKVRPIWGHFYHFHIRMRCPADSAECRPQGSPPADSEDTCGKELADWYALLTAPPKPPDPNFKPAPPPPPLTLSQLPPECRPLVVEGGPRPTQSRK